MSASRPPRGDIHRAIADACARGRGRFAVAIVLDAEGSTPCKAGAKALVDASGAIQGTVGGGQVEAEAQRRAVLAIESGRPAVFGFCLQGRGASGHGPICGGRMRLLVAPADARHGAAYAAAADASARRQRGVLLTAVQERGEREVEVRFYPEHAIPSEPGTGTGPFFGCRKRGLSPLAEAIRSALRREEAECFAAQDAPGLEVLVEPLLPRPVLLIAGGGHVGQALAAQASIVGFEIVVIDDRPEFTSAALFPEGTATRCGEIARELAAAAPGPDTYVVIVTRGHEHDAAALAACIRSPAAYLGMIGSRRKVALLRDGFISSGRATAEEFDRVHAPIGLDIGAVTVPEIAASIVAQLIAVRRTGRAERMPVG